ncbi:fibronectin type III domain-containing protein [Desulfoluna sp.]|uniref:fibronectin type III domain-containing protein n=1 Tax=Desulfoluna sp. TaxID=2045199 RepID=UPI00260BD53B|nr:fibronectin type III domain-containing protein [Desulfoluna sp.]
MKPRRIICPVLLVTLLLLPFSAWAAPERPNDPTLTATHNTLTVSWEAVTDAEGYTIYWGETESEITDKTHPLKRTNSELGLPEPVSEGDKVTFTLGASSGVTLEPETRYYVALSSYDEFRDSTLSDIADVTTQAALQVPPSPQNLSLQARTEERVTFAWDTVTGASVTAYKDSVEKRTGGLFAPASLTPDAPANLETPSANFSGLESDTRYRFRVKATNAEGDSTPSAWLVVDTFAAGELRDTLAPNTPILSPSAHPPELQEDQSVRLRFDGNNSGMADLAGYRVFYGTNAGALDQQKDFTPDADVRITDLEKEVLYTFRLSAFDTSDNESPQSEESVSILVEEVRGLLDDPDAFEGGCFITTPQSRAVPSLFMGIALLLCPLVLVFVPRKKVLTATLLASLSLCLPTPGVAEEANTLGIKAGAHILSDSSHKDIYDSDAASFTLFYQRKLMGPFSAALEAGYLKRDGNKRTTSGLPTEVATELILAPLSASLLCDIPLTPEIILFAGGGLDYWYYKETSDTHEVDAKEENDYGVGGYHGRAGLKLLTRDPMFHHRAGVIIETVYSVIDRFGENEIDLGGWTFNAGIFCTF